jgi:uncharacterized repeat protein (TIGR03833 family)
MLYLIYKYKIKGEGKNMAGEYKSELSIGLTVDIVLKENQRTGILTRGKIKDILTNSSYHPRGCKVRLQDGQIGRVKGII